MKTDGSQMLSLSSDVEDTLSIISSSSLIDPKTLHSTSYIVNFTLPYTLDLIVEAASRQLTRAST